MFLKVKKKIHKRKKNHPLIKKIILVLIQLKENQDLVQEVDKKEKKMQKRQKEVDLNNLKIEIMKNKIKSKEMTKQKEIKNSKNKDIINSIEIEIPL